MSKPTEHTSLLQTPFVSEQVAEKGLLTNPIYVGLANALEKQRRSVYKGNSMMDTFPLMMLESSHIIDNPDKMTFTDVRKNGKTLMQQAIEFVQETQSSFHETSPEDEAIPFDTMGFLDKQSEKYDKTGMMALLNISCYESQAITSDKIMSCLSMLLPIPTTACEYFKLSPKAQEYVLSLDLPSRDVLKEYYEELGKKAECNGGFYDAIIQLVLNGRPTYVYYGFTKSVFFAFRYGQNKCDSEFCWDYTYVMRPFEVEFTDKFREDEIFEIRALLANIWASEITHSTVRTYEPSENRRYIDMAMNGMKTDYKSYSYIKITPEGEASYEESKRIISSARGDAEYRKAVWFTRAYYAKRGQDKHIVLCKASIHHRKCAELSDKPVVQVYV